MKKLWIILISLTVLSCSNVQNSSTSLSAKEFQDKIAELSNAVILDVRTPDEFNGGTIENAINADITSYDFTNVVQTLDKSTPVMVFCLSGGRSKDAAKALRNMGFNTVYELKGGILKWNAENLPVVAPGNSSTAKSDGMNYQDFLKLLDGNKIVIVDFYAEWCRPCKILQPILHEIENENKDKVSLITIDIDKNPLLANHLKIEAIPLVHIYKNQKIQWNNLGLTDKATVLKVIQNIK
jgi:thioredoxin 1